MPVKYPHELLGCCHTCLSNAYLDSEPCKTASEVGYGWNGVPLGDDDCFVRSAQKAFRRKNSLKD